MTNVKIVIGGNFGDEGKGLMTSCFAREMMARSGACLVILSNGGAQRGHTVVDKGVRHVFRHFGSGTLAGADTYFPREFIVNPMIFMKEYRELEIKAPCAIPGTAPGRAKVLINAACPVTTPYEMLANLILEESRGEARHGSVGVGIWETVIGGGLRFGDLVRMRYDEQLCYLMENRKQRLYARLREQGVTKLPAGWLSVVEDRRLAAGFLDDLYEMQKTVIPADDAILRKYEEIIFENGQGLLLDRAMIRKGYGHHTTPSNTGTDNPVRILKDVYGKSSGMDLAVEAVYVTRSYMTRHGAGRFDTECPVEEINPAIRDLTNRPNASQGCLRFGRLHMQSLVRRAKRDYEKIPDKLAEGRSGPRITKQISIAMTHLNEFEHPLRNSRLIKYKSYAEEGDKCVIIR